MKLMIAGSRSFDDYEFLKLSIKSLQLDNISCIVCGEANGADSLGRRFAEDHDINIESFPAQWSKYGKKAGHMRNTLMVDWCDYALYLWDGKSKGTKDCIDKMRRSGKEYKVINYEESNTNLFGLFYENN